MTARSRVRAGGPGDNTDGLHKRAVQERQVLTRHGLVYIGGAVAQGALGFLLLPFLTRIIDVTQFGIVSAALALAAVLTALLPLGLNNSIVRLFYDEPIDVRRAEWASLLVMQMAISLTLALILLATGSVWGELFQGVGWSTPLLLAVVYSFALGVQDTAGGVLRAGRRPGAYVTVILTQTILGGAIALWFASKWEASGYMAGLCVGSSVSATLAMVLAFRRPLWRKAAIFTGLALGVPFLFHSLSNWVLNLSDRLIIENSLGLDKLAEYQIAFVIGSVTFVLFEGMQSAWAPYYFSLPESRKRSLAELLLAPATAAAAGFGCLLAAVAPIVIAIAAPASFGRNYMVIGLVTATVCVRPAYLLGIVTLLDRKRTSRIAIASISAAALNLGLNLLLVPKWGINAAAAATLVAYGLQAVIVDRSVKREQRGQFPMPMMLISWTAATTAILLVALLPTDGVGWVVRAVLIVLIGAFTVFAVQRLRHRFTESAISHMLTR
jgi:O-antigen/teichoic acid export membrane protein